MKIEASYRLKASKEAYIRTLKLALRIEGRLIHVDGQCVTFELDRYPDTSYIRFLDSHAGNRKRGSSNTDMIYTWTGLEGVGVRLYLPKDLHSKAHIEIYNRDEAYAYVKAMTIKQGDNFPGAKKNAKDILAHSGSEFEVLEEVGELTLIRHVKGLAIRYLLVSKVEEAKLKAAKKLKDVAKEIKGYMSVLRFPQTDEVYSVYVAEAMRGQGIGKQLYTVAHKYSKKGIESSDDLGTMSLGTWLSLYKKHEKIQIVVDRKPIPRAEIAVSDLDIKWTKKGKVTDLVGDKLPVFKFFWKK